MIVSCPSCSAKYRIRDEKIQGKGARISCPKCGHRFVVYRESEPAQGLGVPVAFSRGGQVMRNEAGFDEDDESDVPTTVMPHGSQLQQSLREHAAYPDGPPPKLEARIHPARDSEPAATESASVPTVSVQKKKGGLDGKSVVQLVLMIALIGLAVATWFGKGL